MTMISASRSFAAGCSDSQIWPSCNSPSPVITTMRPPRPGEALRARHAVGLRDAHAERAGVGGDERRLDVRMARQAAKPAQAMQQVEVELLERDEQRVERRRVVSLRREVDVRAWRRRCWDRRSVLGPQPRDEIDGAEARADVAGAGLHDHVERVEAADVGEQSPRARSDRTSRARTATIASQRRRRTARRRRRAACPNDLFRPSELRERASRMTWLCELRSAICAVQPPSTTSVAPVM